MAINIVRFGHSDPVRSLCLVVASFLAFSCRVSFFRQLTPPTSGPLILSVQQSPRIRGLRARHVRFLLAEIGGCPWMAPIKGQELPQLGPMTEGLAHLLFVHGIIKGSTLPSTSTSDKGRINGVENIPLSTHNKIKVAKEIAVPYVTAKQHGKQFFLTALFGADLVRISYVARRGVNEEEGAVQRLLNPSRIAGIRDFLLAGGIFPVSIVLNWSDPSSAPQIRNGELIIQRLPQSAQIIDGQHRIIGLAAAIDKDKALARLQLPVSLYTGLSTKECADIFLSINTEQKPVHRSLVFDLYKVASDYIVDPAALRAGDLASALNDNPQSPFLGYIKFPGAPPGQKGLALSTVVSAVKPLVEEKGVFEQVGLLTLHTQTQFLMNFFNVLRGAYGAEWESPSNVFRMAAGFVGAIEFVKNKLVVHCNISGDFTSRAIESVLRLTPGSLIRREAIEGLQGRRAFSYVANALEESFDPTEGKNRKIKI